MMIALLWLVSTSVFAQDEPKFTAKPSGRILFDAAYINPQHQEDDLKSGVGIPDMRVGVNFSYGKWKGKIDMGYAYGKVNMKDVFLQYDFDKQNLIRGGYFIHQYGFQSSTSSSFKETMEERQSNAVFNNDHMIGVMYEYNGQKFLGGYLNDWALCYNFYINKYMIWRVRASYTKVTNRSGYADNECGIF